MSHRFFDPDSLARLGNRELVARRVVEGFLTGRHRSPYHGFSVEYLDHRAYSPGDEIRAIDWKVLARTDKYYVKLFEDETNLRATILLDCSRSMAFKSGEVSKLDYGSYLASMLAYLLLRQNDAVGLVLFDREIREHLMPRARPTQFRRILDHLEAASPREDTAVGPVLHQIAERIRRRGLLVLISDLLDDESEIASGLLHFRHAHHEVIVFHLMDEAERTFPYDRMLRFRDMEGPASLVANARTVREQYLERLDAFLDRVRTACSAHGIGYHLASTREPYEHFLASFLEKRLRLG